MKRILLVEDDAALARSLQDLLRTEGFAVSLAINLKEARAAAAHDLLVLDWMLPDGQGLDFLRALRGRGDWTPAIFLTAKADLVDKVLGLETGANDYLTKPFEPRELLARVRAQLRGKEPARERLECGALLLDLTARQAKLSGKDVETTRKEFDLLALLLTHPGKVFSREELLNKVWGFENFPTTRTVDTHVLQLRQKFGEQRIETVRGIGYRLVVDEEFTRG